MNNAKTDSHWSIVDGSGDPTFYDEAGNLIAGQKGYAPILLLGFVEMPYPQPIRQAGLLIPLII